MEALQDTNELQELLIAYEQEQALLDQLFTMVTSVETYGLDAPTRAYLGLTLGTNMKGCSPEVAMENIVITIYNLIKRLIIRIGNIISKIIGFFRRDKEFNAKLSEQVAEHFAANKHKDIPLTDKLEVCGKWDAFQPRLDMYISLLADLNRVGYMDKVSDYDNWLLGLLTKYGNKVPGIKVERKDTLTLKIPEIPELKNAAIGDTGWGGSRTTTSLAKQAAYIADIEKAQKSLHRALLGNESILKTLQKEDKKPKIVTTDPDSHYDVREKLQVIQRSIAFIGNVHSCINKDISLYRRSYRSMQKLFERQAAREI